MSRETEGWRTPVIVKRQIGRRHSNLCAMFVRVAKNTLLRGCRSDAIYMGTRHPERVEWRGSGFWHRIVVELHAIRVWSVGWIQGFSSLCQCCGYVRFVA